jgi:hypothetical protein
MPAQRYGSCGMGQRLHERPPNVRNGSIASLSSRSRHVRLSSDSRRIAAWERTDVEIPVEHLDRWHATAMATPGLSVVERGILDAVAGHHRDAPLGA